MTAATTLVLDHRFVDDVPELAIDWTASPVPAPQLVVLNEALASELGIDVEWLRSPAGVAVLAGNEVPGGSRPAAMGYAGHQFGSYSPRLGDGRALLLGEVSAADGQVRDIHLKGSGRTPFARGGDGRATLGPMLREHLIAEALHALGVPTTRSLAVVTTGETVVRAVPEPGAILTRVAASHLRVGTFQYARGLDDGTHLEALVRHALARHRIADAGQPALALLRHAIEVQADLVSRWMLVGFIHGVMNTDNMTVSGEGIDYGPCAFMDRFDPATVYSSIDHGGRYAYGNQPAIAQWNLARLAEALLPMIDADPETAVAAATECLEGFVDRYQRAWHDGMATKLGLAPGGPGRSDLIDALVSLQTRAGADHTSTYRALASSLRGERDALAPHFPDRGPELDGWLGAWRSSLGDADPMSVADAIDAVNPIYVPRNHLVEAALGAAVDGDQRPFEDLLELVTHPFRARPGNEAEAQPAPDAFAARHRTFCGT